MLTADTITDEQLRALREDARSKRNLWLIGICTFALNPDSDLDVAEYRHECLARCAKILNERPTSQEHDL